MFSTGLLSVHKAYVWFNAGKKLSTYLRLWHDQWKNYFVDNAKNSIPVMFRQDPFQKNTISYTFDN